MMNTPVALLMELGAGGMIIARIKERVVQILQFRTIVLVQLIVYGVLVVYLLNHHTNVAWEMFGGLTLVKIQQV
jgi:hypothetical protein